MTPDAAPIRAFLRGTGRDGSGRTLADVLAFDDATLEAVHDYIQWLFPLGEASQAVPGSPVLTPEEASAIRADPRALDGLRAALARMTRFYLVNDHWLAPYDHNHLRITRILTAARSLLPPDAAAGFYASITARHEAAGAPVNTNSLRYWRLAVIA
jgi:hypothetical protein